MCYRLNTVLYHDTISKISQVNVSLKSGRKDFGMDFDFNTYRLRYCKYMLLYQL